MLGMDYTSSRRYFIQSSIITENLSKINPFLKKFSRRGKSPPHPAAAGLSSAFFARPGPLLVKNASVRKMGNLSKSALHFYVNLSFSTVPRDVENPCG